MKRYGVPWVLALACALTVGCGEPKKEAPTASATAAVKRPPRPPMNFPLRITFTEPDPKNGKKADCAASLDQKTITVHHSDTVTWSLYNNGCSKFQDVRVHLKFDDHTLKGSDDPYGQNGAVSGEIDDASGGVGNNTAHTYKIRIKGATDEDAGDPEIDVNDCSPPVTPLGK